MKKILLVILILSFMVFGLTGCDSEQLNEVNENETPVIEENKEPTVPTYYEDDESINLFINKYNIEFEPDITTDMITKKHIGGRDRDDVVTISNDKLEIIIYGSNKYNDLYSMSVYIGYIPKVSSTNDDYKEQFIKYVKLLDESLTDEEINTYWNDMISEYRSSYEINEIDITPNIINGKVEYFKMTGKVKM